jgi:hypothetical protein
LGWKSTVSESEVAQHLARQRRQPGLRVPHGRGRIVVDDPKLPWPSTRGSDIEKSCARRTSVS